MQGGGQGQGAGGRDVRVVPGLQGQVQRGVRGPSRVGTEHPLIGNDLQCLQQQLHLLRGTTRGQLSSCSRGNRGALLPLRPGGLLHAPGEAVRQM